LRLALGANPSLSSCSDTSVSLYGVYLHEQLRCRGLQPSLEWCA
jgi:hypothetical protein